MRFNKLILIVLTFIVTFNSNAAEQILEPHAMLYYRIPFAGARQDQNKHTFGFRMDRAVSEPGKPVDYQNLFRQPAVFDLQMGQEGIEALTISGVDYLQRLRALRANGEEEAVPEEGAGEEAPAESAPAEEQGSLLDKLPEFSDIVEEGQYLGLTIGVLLAAGFLLGVGE